MQITSIEARNFKSLTAFKLSLPKFCCLVGNQLSKRLGVIKTSQTLVELLESKTIDVDQINMPSFRVFRQRLESVLV